MKPFMDDDFLLESQTAKILYHEHAENLPIVDYHCHINPREIYEDKHYDSITEAWLGGDHYKWRAMRWNGVPEADITGCKDTDPYRTFEQWAGTLPRAVGNPLYHWTYLELKKYFGVTEPLNPASARRIYDQCGERLSRSDMGVRGIIARSNVEVICTTDDPADTLEWHRKIREDDAVSVKVLPAFRPDKAMNAHKPGFAEYLTALGDAAGNSVGSFAELCAALDARIDFFHQMGCRVSDHALDYCMYIPASGADLETIFRKAVGGGTLAPSEIDAFKTALLLRLSRKYSQYGWAMQLHFGCIRDNNSVMFQRLGPDTGFDAVSNAHGVDDLGRLLDAMNRQGTLPRTILYSLNPHDNEAVATIAGCFQADAVCPGQIQLGAAWWFNDTRTGMEKQLTDLANLGVLGTFVGMLTDSRSFLSYTRHEYFRRILCNWLGRLAENGECHADMESLGRMVEDISYHNAVRYFGFGN